MLTLIAQLHFWHVSFLMEDREITLQGLARGNENRQKVGIGFIATESHEDEIILLDIHYVLGYLLWRLVV